MKKATRVVREVEEQQEVVKLKKVPSVQPKDTEKEEKPQTVTKTTVLTTEEIVHREESTEVSLVTRTTVQEKTPRERAEVSRRPDTVQAPEKEEKEAPSEVWNRQKPVPTEEKPEEKITLKKVSKAPKEEEPAPPSAALKKVKKLPSEEVTSETVKLKPFDKPTKPTEDMKKDEKEKPDRDAKTFQRGEKIPRELEVKEPQKKPEEGPGEATEPPAKVPKPSEKKKSAEKEPEEAKTPSKIKKIPPKEPEMESVKLKPISKPFKETVEPEKKPAEEKDKKPVDELLRRRTTPEEKAKELETETKPKKAEISEASEQKMEEPKEKEAPPAAKKVSPVSMVKKPEQVPEEPKPLQLKKGVVPKPQEEKEEVVLKPLQGLKKVQLKKTPSPKTVSPKESIEAVTLKKVPKKPSPEEKKVPVVKEVSPGAVQLRKVATQPEEEVFPEEFSAADEEAEQGEDEAWGWELVPQEPDQDWEGEGEEGAVEVPGLTRRGEMVASTGRLETGNSRPSPALNILHRPPSWLHLKASPHLHRRTFSVPLSLLLCVLFVATMCHVSHHPSLIYGCVLMVYLHTFSSLSHRSSFTGLLAVSIQQCLCRVHQTHACFL